MLVHIVLAVESLIGFGVARWLFHARDPWIAAALPTYLVGYTDSMTVPTHDVRGLI